MNEILDAVQALQPELAKRAAEMEEARRLPTDLAARMAPAGVFRLLTPKRFGGAELSPRGFVEVVEALSVANASAGWCSMIGSTTGLTAAYMPTDVAAGIYADPDVIISDVAMPGMNGIELCSRVREELPEVPVILMSGWTSGVDPARARRAGAVSLLKKPFALQQVESALRAITDERRDRASALRRMGEFQSQSGSVTATMSLSTIT